MVVYSFFTTLFWSVLDVFGFLFFFHLFALKGFDYLNDTEITFFLTPVKFK